MREKPSSPLAGAGRQASPLLGVLNLDLDNEGTMHSVSLLTMGRGGRAKSIEEDVNSNTPTWVRQAQNK